MHVRASVRVHAEAHGDGDRYTLHADVTCNGYLPRGHVHVRASVRVHAEAHGDGVRETTNRSGSEGSKADPLAVHIPTEISRSVDPAVDLPEKSHLTHQTNISQRYIVKLRFMYISGICTVSPRTRCMQQVHLLSGGFGPADPTYLLEIYRLSSGR